MLYKAELRMSESNLFHSFMSLGMKKFLKYSDLHKNRIKRINMLRITSTLW